MNRKLTIVLVAAALISLALSILAFRRSSMVKNRLDRLTPPAPDQPEEAPAAAAPATAAPTEPAHPQEQASAQPQAIPQQPHTTYPS